MLQHSILPALTSNSSNSLGDLKYVAISRAIFRIILVEVPLWMRDGMTKRKPFLFIDSLTESLEDKIITNNLPDVNPTKLFAYHKLIHQKKMLAKEDTLFYIMNFFFARRVGLVNDLIPEIFCGHFDVRF